MKADQERAERERCNHGREVVGEEAQRKHRTRKSRHARRRPQFQAIVAAPTRLRQGKGQPGPGCARLAQAVTRLLGHIDRLTDKVAQMLDAERDLG
jgi:hypothetical protein